MSILFIIYLYFCPQFFNLVLRSAGLFCPHHKSHDCVGGDCFDPSSLTLFCAVPAYFALITRAMIVLEGIAVTGDPEFDLFKAAYPYRY
jgi:hypothetical protein